MAVVGTQLGRAPRDPIFLLARPDLERGTDCGRRREQVDRSRDEQRRLTCSRKAGPIIGQPVDGAEAIAPHPVEKLGEDARRHVLHHVRQHLPIDARIDVPRIPGELRQRRMEPARDRRRGAREQPVAVAGGEKRVGKKLSQGVLRMEMRRRRERHHTRDPRGERRRRDEPQQSALAVADPQHLRRARRGAHVLERRGDVLRQIGIEAPVAWTAAARISVSPEVDGEAVEPRFGEREGERIPRHAEVEAAAIHRQAVAEQHRRNARLSARRATRDGNAPPVGRICEAQLVVRRPDPVDPTPEDSVQHREQQQCHRCGEHEEPWTPQSPPSVASRRASWN